MDRRPVPSRSEFESAIERIVPESLEGFELDQAVLGWIRAAILKRISQ